MSGLIRPFGSYFKAGELDPTMKSAQALSEHVKEQGLRFSYGKVTFDSFQKVYCSTEFFAYKIVALPSAFVAGVVKLICHLAYAVFISIPKTCYQLDARPFKAIVLIMIRDLEEALGWMITIVNEVRGQYLVEKSLFQKTCYSIALEDSVNNSATVLTVKKKSQNSLLDEAPNQLKALSTSLKYFHLMDEGEKQKTIDKCQLDTNLVTPQLLQQMDEIHPAVLDLVTLGDLKLRPQLVKLALMPEDEFKLLSLNKLVAYMFNESGKEGISALTIINEKAARMSFAEAALIEIPENCLDLTLEQFRSLTASQIYLLEDKLPLSVYGLLSISQIKSLDFKKMSTNQIIALFEEKERKAATELFSHLNPAQVQVIVSDSVPLSFLSYLNENQINSLELDDITESALESIFAWTPNGSEKRKFSRLTPQQVQSILTKLGPNLLKLVTSEQLPHLDLSALDKVQLQILLRDKYFFSLLSAPQVQAILKKLSSDQLLMITPDQIQHLDLSVLSKYQVQSLFQWRFNHEEEQLFNLLSASQVQGILTKLSGYQLALVNATQIPELDLSGLNSDQLECMFAFRKDRQHIARFNALKPKQIQENWDLIGQSKNLLGLINADQMQSLDLRNISKECFELLFSDITTYNKLRFARIKPEHVQLFIKNNMLKKYQMELVTFEQFKEF